MQREPIVCPICNRSVVPRWAKQRYCSVRCAGNAGRRQEKLRRVKRQEQRP